MSNSQPGRFENFKELKTAASSVLGRVVSAQDIEAVDPEGLYSEDAPYSREDLTELINLLKDHYVQVKPPIEKRRRIDTMGRVKQEAAEAKGFVFEQRMRLFGASAPPCKDAVEAANWIHEHMEERPNSILELEFLVSKRSGTVDQLSEVRILLDEALNEVEDQPDPDRAFFRWMARDGRITRHGSRAWLLPYFKFNPEGQQRPGMFQTVAFPGTLLGELYEEMLALAKATAWSDEAALHHLLTGGLFASRVQASTNVSAGNRSFSASAITLKIKDPLSVTEAEVLSAFRRARSGLSEFFRPGKDSKRQRGRAVLSPELVPFVNEHQQLSWDQKHKEWNRLHPDQQLLSANAMRMQFARGRHRHS